MTVGFSGKLLSNDEMDKRIESELGKETKGLRAVKNKLLSAFSKMANEGYLDSDFHATCAVANRLVKASGKEQRRLNQAHNEAKRSDPNFVEGTPPPISEEMQVSQRFSSTRFDNQKHYRTLRRLRSGPPI